MAGPHPAVAAVRSAVRSDLRALTAGLDAPADGAPAPLVLVAVSGGPDSTALAAALAFEAPKLGLRAGALTVDHAWSGDSPARAAAVLGTGRQLGLDPLEVLSASAPRSEGVARDRRRAALLAAVERHRAVALLLGHTVDDQAETVLLRLARGSGSRSLAGMPAVAGVLRRPLLGLRRTETRRCCAELGLPVWDDPANDDPAFLRNRVRAELLPLLHDVLGPGAVPALARSADLLRADADALDALAGSASERPDALTVEALEGLLPALRSRVLRRAALAAGSPGTDLSAAHVAALEALVTHWHGQGPIPLPGGLVARRRDGRIEIGRDAGPARRPSEHAQRTSPTRTPTARDSG